MTTVKLEINNILDMLVLFRDIEGVKHNVKIISDISEYFPPDNILNFTQNTIIVYGSVSEPININSLITAFKKMQKQFKVNIISASSYYVDNVYYDEKEKIYYLSWVPHIMGDELNNILFILNEIGYELIIYHSHVLSDNNNKKINKHNRRDYSHCMYGQDFFAWILDVNRKLGETIIAKENLIFLDEEEIDLNLYVNDLAFHKNNIYIMSLSFDDSYCHYFTILTTHKSMIIFNTSEDNPGRMIIKEHSFYEGVRLIKKIMRGLFDVYETFFGFSYPDNIVRINTIYFRQINFRGITLNEFKNKLDEIYIHINNDDDKNKFGDIIDIVKQ